MAKSILVRHETTNLSPTMVVEEYKYYYIEGFDAKRPRARHKSEKRVGWVRKIEDREDIKTEQGGVWIVRDVWQKKKESKRAKKDK